MAETDVSSEASTSCEAEALAHPGNSPSEKK